MTSPASAHLFRRLSWERLTTASQVGHLMFFADHATLADPAADNSDRVSEGSTI
jgi:hypothetical protein